MSSHDVQYNTETGEPFLSLPPPHGPRIRLTPPRMTDVQSLVQHFNDPRVYTLLSGPPFPYTEAHASLWITARLEEAKAYLEGFNELERQSSIEVEKGGEAGVPITNTPRWVTGCPFRILREVDDGGAELFIGDAFIGRSMFPEILDEGEKEQRRADNLDRKAGDPTIVYTFGNFLAPSHHGRGIMTATIQTIIETWAKPLMGAKLFTVGVLSRNVASRRVFEKNGFQLFVEHKGGMDMTRKGGGLEDIMYLARSD